MFRHKQFDVDIERAVDAARLRWPAGEEAGHDGGLGGNRHYADLRGFGWTAAREVFAAEDELIRRIELAKEPDSECLLIEDEQYDDVDDGLLGLDLGVASSVAALSAARCVPFSSCNGGAFGGRHNELYPLVAFCARAPILPLLLECAEAAEVGLNQTDGGELVLYAADVRNMRRFAAHLYDRRKQANDVRYKKRARHGGADQPKLL